MNKSELFKQAHQLTKKIRQPGDDYRSTFGFCLKAIREGYTMEQRIIARHKTSFIQKAASLIANHPGDEGDFLRHVAAGEFEQAEKLYAENKLDWLRIAFMVDFESKNLLAERVVNMIGDSK